MNKNTLKSIGGFILAFIVSAGLAIGTDSLLEKVGIFPAIQTGIFIWWMLLLATIYRNIYLAIGGYIVAALAPQNPKRHVMVFGIASVLGNFAGLTGGLNMPNIWYPILLVIFAYPSVWFGGKIYTK